jgi:SAM-dependent methyltransferase
MGGIGGNLRRALFGVGPRATLQAVARRAHTLIFAPASPSSAVPDPFDTEWGISTAGFHSWRELRSGSGNDAYNAGYLPIDAGFGRRLLQTIEDRHVYTLIDVGCGKGRVLALAAEAGFRRVMGIEISRALFDIARANAKIIDSRFTGRVPIEVLQGDATEMVFPDEPLVIFMYKPFLLRLTERFASRIAASFADSPREILIYYANPKFSSAFDGLPFLERVAAPADRFEGAIVWRTRRSAKDGH